MNALESVDELWKRNLQTEINTLEVIYDSQTDGSISKWKEESIDLEINTIKTIKNMASSYVNKYLRQPDSSITSKAESIDNWFICPNCTNAWESNSIEAMIVCPKCEQILHNPRYLKT